MKKRLFAFLAAGGLVLTLAAAELGVRSAPAARARTTEADITRVTASLLERSQFSHHPLDNELAAKFLDRYLDALDEGRVLFLQSDAGEFSGYRATLAQATRRAGDTTAARAIFDRYLERLQQRESFVTNALQTAPFDFTGREVYSSDRENGPRPSDPAAARGLWLAQLRAQYLQEKLAGQKPEGIVKILTRRYTRLSRNMRELNRDDVLELYLNALAHVYDPHSDYLGREQMESFSIAMNLSLVGVGATLQEVDGSCVIRELVPGGPAARGGLLKPGDRIVAVAQAGQEPVDIVSMPLPHAVELIRGPKGSVVRLTILPSGAVDDAARKTVALTREEINLEDQEARARILDLPRGPGRPFRLGVIDLPSFYAGMGDQPGGTHHSASADVARLLDKLEAENVRGVILDLRRNGGGSLEEAINLTGLFTGPGPVVQTRGPDGDIEVDADRAPARYLGPLVVLTSRFSASASEILAGALQDYGRAVIVGDSSTFGKGTVQTVLPLDRIMDRNGLRHAYDPGALKLTVRKFYRPSGASTQLKGVASDIVLPSESDAGGVGESALKDPLPWDIVPSADYRRFNEVRPYLVALREDSARRVAAEKDFALVREDLALEKRALATKSVSLNEVERRKEMALAKARREEFDREIRALRPTEGPAYEITLKNASLPGLPPPLAVTSSPAPAAGSAVGEDALDAEDGDRSPSADIVLTETERILEAYAALLGRKNDTVSTAR